MRARGAAFSFAALLPADARRPGMHPERWRYQDPVICALGAWV